MTEGQHLFVASVLAVLAILALGGWAYVVRKR